MTIRKIIASTFVGGAFALAFTVGQASTPTTYADTVPVPTADGIEVTVPSIAPSIELIEPTAEEEATPTEEVQVQVAPPTFILKDGTAAHILTPEEQAAIPADAYATPLPVPVSPPVSVLADGSTIWTYDEAGNQTAPHILTPEEVAALPASAYAQPIPVSTCN